MKFRILKEIARESLNMCVTPDGYTAGTHHFIDLWARDSFFACLGDIESINTLNTLNTFKKYQRKDGLIPYRIRRSSLNLGKYFGKPKMLEKLKPDFRSFQSGATVFDGGVLYLLTISKRLLVTKNDIEILDFSKSIEKVYKYYKNKFKGQLIYEGYLCEWVDEVLKHGNTLYTNVLYIASLKSLLKLVEKSPDYFSNISVIELNDEITSLKKELYEKLWNGKYFSDFYTFKRYDYLSSYSNLLAVIFDITNKEESKSILSEIEQKCDTGNGILSNYPKYPWYMIPFYTYIIGMQDYHNGILWLQPWIAYVIALKRVGNIEKANIELEKIQKIVKEKGVIFENYENDWSPVKRMFYTSEGPFAWSSGKILWALNEFEEVYSE